MNNQDFVCGMDCPKKLSPPYCCQNCHNARRNYLNEENKHLWTEESGFWSEDGCKLPRDRMPEACRTYDCREYTFTLKRSWGCGKWFDYIVKEEYGHTTK